MGKNLHPNILSFFKDRMNSHQAVESIDDISTEDFYIFNVKRNGGRTDIVIVLSDCYYYGEIESLSLPSELANGGIVLIAKPEAQFFDNQINDNLNKILVTKIGGVLGALNKPDFWEYKIPEKKEREK